MLQQSLPQKQVLFQQPILCIIINTFADTWSVSVSGSASFWYLQYIMWDFLLWRNSVRCLEGTCITYFFLDCNFNLCVCLIIISGNVDFFLICLWNTLLLGSNVNVNFLNIIVTKCLFGFYQCFFLPIYANFYYCF